jgi:hypothetical protein
MNIEPILATQFPSDVVRALLEAYKEIESNFAIEKWKASELDAGHFVEAARRMIEHKLFGISTPIGISLAHFNDAELRRYEQGSGDDSYRMLIPRALKAVFNVRNKRGIGHLGAVSANEMDATYILYSTKWILAEFVRLASGLSPDKTQELIDSIVERRLSVLWKHKDITRVLATGILARNQILILLYDRNLQTETELRDAIEYKNSSNFRQILCALHRERLIEFALEKQISITSTGIMRAEAELQLYRKKKG